MYRLTRSGQGTTKDWRATDEWKSEYRSTPYNPSYWQQSLKQVKPNCTCARASFCSLTGISCPCSERCWQMSGDHSQLAGMICVCNCSSWILTSFWTNNNYDERKLRVCEIWSNEYDKFGPGDWLCWLTCFMVFLSPFRKMSPCQKGSAANFENNGNCKEAATLNIA